MLFRATVRDTTKTLVAAALTQQGATVASSKDTPAQTGNPPQVDIYVEDTKEGVSTSGAGAPTFRTKVTIALDIKCEAATVEAAETLLDALCEAIENGLLGDPTFVKLFEGIDSFDTTPEYNGTSQARNHVFMASIVIVAHVTEIFEPTVSQNLAGLNVYVDSRSIFDPSGDYSVDPQEPFPVTPPPRTSGPDGRPEIAASIDLPTE